MNIGRGPAERLGATLSDHWWVLLLRGIVAIVFGVLTFAQPGISLATLVVVFGSFAFADGVLKAYTAVAHRRDADNWGLMLLSGLVGIGVGIVTWMTPAVTALALLFYIAIWAISSGLLEVVTAIRLRKAIEGEWRLMLSGLASIGFGVLLMARPSIGALSVLWLIGSFALVFGLALIALSFKMRSVGHRLESHAT